MQNALGYHCDKGLVSSIVSWIVAGNVTPSFVEGNANSSQVGSMIMFYEQSWDKQSTDVFFCCIFPGFADFVVLLSFFYYSVFEFAWNKILI